MKKIFHSISAIIIGLIMIPVIFTGCEKDYLETKPATSVSEKDIYTDVETAQGVLQGVYRQLKSWGIRYSSAGQAGIHSAAMVRDVMGPDVDIIKSWFSYEAAYSAFSPSSSRVAWLWSDLYFIINSINNLLSRIDDLSGTDEEKNMMKGEALAVRGWAYFELIQTYQHTYTIGSTLPGIPIYTEPSIAETKGNPRGTVEDVYQQILSDLTTALPIIGSYRPTKMAFNDDVVEAVLAQVYLTMGNWSQAITYARSLKADYPLMSAAEWQSGFKEMNNEWIWAQDNNPDENPGWGCAHVFMDPINGGAENDFRLSDTLVASYSATDIRGALIVDDGSGFNGTLKFLNTSSPLFSGDYPLIRSTEMYMIEAEALAKSGDEVTARQVLYDVQLRADPNAVITTASGQTLIDEILFEKRKEFWGEGIIFRDMLRNQLPLEREVTNTFVVNIPANSWDFIFPIPESEILINESINQSDQNPITGVLSK